MNKKDIIVCYHAYCRDGYCGCVVMKYYEKMYQNKINIIQIIPIIQGRVQESLKNEIIKSTDEIYFIDVNMTTEDLQFTRSIIPKAKIFIFDHHEYPNGIDLSDNTYFVLDKTKCGSHLIWEYLFPFAELPELLKHIEYRDLWLDRGLDALYIGEYLFTMLNLWNLDLWLEYIDVKDWTEFRYIGKILYDRKKREVNGIIKNGQILEIKNPLLNAPKESNNETNMEKIKIFVVNANIHISDVGAKMVEINNDIAFAVMWRYMDDGVFHISLRSREFNVEEFARFYGGGGHKCAAGFKSKTLQMFDLPINIGD